MKKKLLLLCTFLISFIIYTDAVDAAKELTCIYEVEDEYIALIQYSDGTHKINSNKDSSSLESSGWVTEKNGNDYHIKLNYSAKNKDCGYTFCGRHEIIRDGSRYLDKSSSSSNVITQCPKMAEFKKPAIGAKNKFNFYDEVKNKDNYPLVDNKNLISEVKGSESIKKIESSSVKEKTIYKENSDEAKKIDKNYKLKCRYKLSNGNTEIYLYIYDNDYIITQSGGFTTTAYSQFNFNELSSIVEATNYCPSKLWSSSNGEKIFLTKKDGKKEYNLMSCNTSNGQNCKVNISGSEDIGKAEINNCSDLFGESLIKEINSALNIVKIAVPILLLIFGTIDFLKATFASSEDDMKKSREQFIKRIIAAVIVFLVPLFVNLVLKVSNMVWSDINPDTCINEK